MKNNTNKPQYYIYKITCKVNNKSYIGDTTNPNHRFYRCHYVKNPELLADIDKYGMDAFDHKFLARTNDYKLAQSLESHLIEKYDTIRNGYNRIRAFAINVGLHRTAESNAKRRAAISNTVWMHDPATGQSTRANPYRAKQLESKGWRLGRIKDKDAVFQASQRNKILPVEIPEGEGDWFASAM